MWKLLNTREVNVLRLLYDSIIIAYWKKSNCFWLLYILIQPMRREYLLNSVVRHRRTAISFVFLVWIIFALWLSVFKFGTWKINSLSRKRLFTMFKNILKNKTSCNIASYTKNLITFSDCIQDSCLQKSQN